VGAENQAVVFIPLTALLAMLPVRPEVVLPTTHKAKSSSVSLLVSLFFKQGNNTCLFVGSI